ncbi:MAG: thioredoxin 1 [bacterium P3]|nr:MAG: thioredoxin 1 [bacterium P3]KWW42760.1 MAG: thioredoxin 1 [bacterium F083]
MTITVTEDQFQSMLNTDKPVMIDCSATWCGPCKALAPVIDEIAAEYEGRAVVGKMDVEECPGISMQYRIRNVPTVLFFKNGKVKDKSVGLVQKSTLTEKLDALM